MMIDCIVRLVFKVINGFEMKTIKQLALESLIRGETSFDPMRNCARGHKSLRNSKSQQCHECRKENRKLSLTFKEQNKAQSKKFSDKNRFRKNEISRESYAKRKLEGKVKVYDSRALFIRQSINRIVYNWKGSRKAAEKAVGYSADELKRHLESLFCEGMSWGNYGEWHIDHIKSVSAFIKDGVTCPSVVNAISNLQPLWATENLSKGG
jgi:hypothetical protein